MAPALTAFNTAGDQELRTRLAGCCAAESWVERVLAGRPYAAEAELLAASDDATTELGDAGLEQALAGHPRIGECRSTRAGKDHAGEDRAAAWSRQEQAGVATAEAEVLSALAAANAAYELRFGHVYLVCAAGRGAAELLDVCRGRLDNDPVTERAVVLHELARINRLRLGKLLSEEMTS